MLGQGGRADAGHTAQQAPDTVAGADYAAGDGLLLLQRQHGGGADILKEMQLQVVLADSLVCLGLVTLDGLGTFTRVDALV